MFKVKTDQGNIVEVRVLLRKNGWLLHKEVEGKKYTITHENSGLAIPNHLTSVYPNFSILKYIVKALPDVSKMDAEQVIKIRGKIMDSMDKSYMSYIGL